MGTLHRVIQEQGLRREFYSRSQGARDGERVREINKEKKRDIFLSEYKMNSAKKLTFFRTLSFKDNL